VLLAVLWDGLRQAVGQLFWGMLLALALLPLTKRLECRLSAPLASAIALGAAGAMVAGALLFLLPPLISQAREMAALAPELFARAGEKLGQAQLWLAKSGLPVDEELKNGLLGRGKELLGTAAPAVMNGLRGLAGQVGRWLLAPVFAYYFLRDRQLLGAWLLSLLPLEWRAPAVRVLREMRRETAGYVRGQLMVSGIVGALTAVGLLLCRVPAWMVLGAFMGVMELIPYAGPFLGGAAVLAFSLTEGWSRTLWALGVVLAVQQIEGSFLSPRLVSDATRLHPLAVLLCVMLGGAAGGVTGILLAVPLVLCVRAALRILSLSNSIHPMYKKRFSKN